LAQISAILPELLSRTEAGQHGVRLVGLSASGLMKKGASEQKNQLEFEKNNCQPTILALLKYFLSHENKKTLALDIKKPLTLL